MAIFEEVKKDAVTDIVTKTTTESFNLKAANDRLAQIDLDIEEIISETISDKELIALGKEVYQNEKANRVGSLKIEKEILENNIIKWQQ